MSNGFDIIQISPISLDDWTPSKWRWAFHSRVERGVKRGHTLVQSDHGIGKTYSGMIIAKTLGLPMWYVSASFGLERSTLEGQWFPRNGKDGPSLVATDGYVASAVVGNGLLVVDEFFRLPQDVQSALFAAADSHRGLYTIAYRGATIKVGPEFRLLGFTNPPSPMYPEVEIADRALLSRFGTVIRVKFPQDRELARYMAHLDFPKEHLVQTINFVLRVRAAYEKGDLDNFISPRDLGFFTAALKDGMTIDEAFSDVIVGKFAERYEEAVKGFWKMHTSPPDSAEDAIDRAFPAVTPVAPTAPPFMAKKP